MWIDTFDSIYHQPYHNQSIDTSSILIRYRPLVIFVMLLKTNLVSQKEVTSLASGLTSQGSLLRSAISFFPMEMSSMRVTNGLQLVVW